MDGKVAFCQDCGGCDRFGAGNCCRCRRESGAGGKFSVRTHNGVGEPYVMVGFAEAI